MTLPAGEQSLDIEASYGKLLAYRYHYDYLNKKGIVKDKKIHGKVIERILSTARLYGFEPLGTCESPIEGGDGNVEFLACFILHKE